VHKTRLEAFSDGVIAIIITIMVLKMKVPHDSSLEALLKLGPVFLSYVISFLYIGIYWNNHHHLFQSIQRIDGRVLWANLALLFWLSLVPFASGWMGENHFETATVVLYGIVMFAAAISYYILTLALLKCHGSGSVLHQAVGSKFKERISLVLYLLALAIAAWVPMVAFGIYVLVALIWLYPDSRIEKIMAKI